MLYFYYGRFIIKLTYYYTTILLKIHFSRKKQFPSKSFCPECYEKGSNISEFNEIVTLEFLKNQYRDDSITNPIQRRSTSADSGSKIHTDPDLLLLFLLSAII